jgi:hypothetical protein
MPIFRKKQSTAKPSASPLTIHLMVDEGTFDEGTGDVSFDGFWPYLDLGCTRRMPFDELCPDEPRVFYSNVAGVSFHAGQLQLSCFDVGQVVALVPEPTNTADTNAIQVVGSIGKRMYPTGYVPAPIARQLAGVAQGQTGQGIVVQTFSKGGARVGLRIVGSFGRVLQAKSV